MPESRRSVATSAIIRCAHSSRRLCYFLTMSPACLENEKLPITEIGVIWSLSCDVWNAASQQERMLSRLAGELPGFLVPKILFRFLPSSRFLELGVLDVIRPALVAALLLMAAPGLAAQGGRRSDRNSPEQRKAETIRNTSQRLSRLASRLDLSQENRILGQKVSALLERARQAAAGSYLLDRLESAMDDLLDASEEILESRLDLRERQGNRDRRQDPDEARRATVRELERSYFRIQQGDYFARQSQETNAQEYVLLARRLYQLARAAYDAGDYLGARGLSEASQKVIDALESLAQAAVPIPEPPRLPEN